MSHWIMGIMSVMFALIGLFLGAGARDLGILLFGLGLFVTGVLFAGWMIRTAYDEAESSS
jgi:hypothetical protein